MILLMQKRTFLLLEVLIALFLVSLCIVPLIRQPLQMFKNELEKLEMVEKERLADWTFSEIKEMFLKNEIPWEKIPPLNQKTDPIPMLDRKLHLPGCKEKKIPCFFTLWTRGAKDGASGEEYRQIYIDIYLGKQKYQYRLPMQKLYL